MGSITCSLYVNNMTVYDATWIYIHSALTASTVDHFGTAQIFAQRHNICSFLGSLDKVTDLQFNN